MNGTSHSNRHPSYVRPETLDEALEFLDARGGETKVVAGGTDVMIELRAGHLDAAYLLDIGRLNELKGIDLTNGELGVGAGTTISQIGDSPILARHAPCLQKCARTFASRQIRNVATIGGNVAQCSPCGDTLPSLVVHDARAVLANKSGSREVPVAEIASGPNACSLPNNEIILRFVLRPADANFADFQKIGRRKALAVARISMAAMANTDADGRITVMRVAVGACLPTPQRQNPVEDFLVGKVPDRDLIWEAGGMLAQHVIEISGRRVSAEYKEPAIRGLFMRMLWPLTK